VFRFICFFIAAFALIASVASHELPENRATLVLRDRTHLTLTLFIEYPEALHLALMPQKTFKEFVLIYSAMEPQRFQQALLSAQTQFQSETKLIFGNGSVDAQARWVWPASPTVQALLQKEVMQLMVGAQAQAHEHDPPTEIRAEIVATQDITQASIQLPQAFQKVLLVWYQPKQMWLAPGARSAAIKFVD
jgi:hypothetical protein